MSHFFKFKNNQNKYYVYLLISKDKQDKPNKNTQHEEYENVLFTGTTDISLTEYKQIIYTKILITQNLILHDLTYILNNYDTIVNNSEYKIIENITLGYFFKNTFPEYPYDLFYTNRVLLHSFIYVCEYIKSVQNIFKDKVYFISNNNYLKRIRDWSPSWRKNRYSIEKYQNNLKFKEHVLLCSSSRNTSEQSDTNNNANEMNDNSKSVFSINDLVKCYFDIFEYNSSNHLESEHENTLKNKYSFVSSGHTETCFKKFECVPVLLNDESLFERTLERPNTDYIEKCFPYFEEYKQLRFL
jgi:hypothetical protein